MSRRGRRGTNGEHNEGPWLPADDAGERGGYRGRGSRAGHWPQDPPTGPPWETGGWEAADFPGHPSGPLPAGPPADAHPSGPLPPLPGPGWGDGPQDGWPAGSRGGGGAPRPGHPSGGYPEQPGGGPGSGAFAPPGDYRTGGFPAAGGEYPSGGYPAAPGPGEYPSGSYPAARGEYPSGGYPAPPGDYQAGDLPSRDLPSRDLPSRDLPSGGFPSGDLPSGEFPSGTFPRGGYGDDGYGTGGYLAGDYGSGSYPAAPDYAGRGFGEPSYQREYESPGDYQDDDDQPGYAGRGPGNHRGYPDRGGWYGDVDEQQVWTGEDEADSGFLPGLGGGAGPGGREREGGRPGRGRPGGRPAKRKPAGLRRIMPRVFLGLLLVVVLAGGGAGYYVYRTYISPPDYSGPGTGSVVVQIKNGDTATVVGQRLQLLGVVASARAFANAAKASPQGNALEPGYYTLHRHMQASLAFALLLKPSSRLMYKVVIPEGLRLSQIIATLGKATHNLAGYQAAIKNVSALHLPPYANGNPEGYLFPATYTIAPGTPPLQVLQEMVQRFKQEAVSANLATLARQHQISEHDLIVTASLIQAEGGRLQDFPKIARVIYNRLYVAHMQLELDSTVMYALHTYGIMASNQQLQVNSPYNTYRHFGLPPGPIDSPGDAAIQAALHPAPGNWLYFVTVDPKTGLTEFTSDPNVFAQLRQELQQNVAKGK